MQIGIDLGGTKIEAAAFGPGGVERFRRRVATPRDDYDATLDAVAALVRDVEAATGGTGAVGVGTPGAISPATGLIKNANSTWLNGRPLRRDLESRLGREVRVANDADCFALSEAVDGAGAGAASVFGVIVGTGTGAGVVIGGRLLAGPNAVAGEWGHNPLPWPRDGYERPGPACWCGKRGCLETYLSGPGLARDYRARTGRGRRAEEIVDGASGGDAEAEGALARYADRMARGLAMVINVLDPEVIVLGGGMSAAAGLYAAVPARWERYVFSDRVATRLLPPVHGDAGGVRGAAWLWPETCGS